MCFTFLLDSWFQFEIELQLESFRKIYLSLNKGSLLNFKIIFTTNSTCNDLREKSIYVHRTYHGIFNLWCTSTGMMAGEGIWAKALSHLLSIWARSPCLLSTHWPCRVKSRGPRSSLQVSTQRWTHVFSSRVYLLCILSICPWLSLFHAHQQKSYSLQKPIR